MGVIRVGPAMGLAFAVFVLSRPLFCRCLRPWSLVLLSGLLAKRPALQRYRHSPTPTDTMLANMPRPQYNHYEQILRIYSQGSGVICL